jgi:hypothetical protein
LDVRERARDGEALAEGDAPEEEAGQGEEEAQVKYENRLGSKRWNERYNRLYDRAVERKQRITRELLADGMPPFQVETTPQQQLELLETALNTGADWFFNGPSSKAAQADLYRLRNLRDTGDRAFWGKLNR